MTGEESRALRAGDRVRWGDTDLGTVIEQNWAGVTVKWQDRSEQTILHNDMGRVEQVPNKLV